MVSLVLLALLQLQVSLPLQVLLAKEALAMTPLRAHRASSLSMPAVQASLVPKVLVSMIDPVLSS